MPILRNRGHTGNASCRSRLTWDRLSHRPHRGYTMRPGAEAFEEVSLFVVPAILGLALFLGEPIFLLGLSGVFVGLMFCNRIDDRANRK